MRRLLPFFACVMLVLTLWVGTVAHAAETMPIADVASLSWEHSMGDADEVPADADKDVPHHHGLCHGHDISVPLGFSACARVAASVSRYFVPVAPLHAIQADNALRPPKA